MKKFKFLSLLVFPVLLVNLTGCYTQLATRDDYGNWNREEQKPYYDYENDSDTLSDEYSDEQYDNNEYNDQGEESYTEDRGQTNYYFYGYPSYRKYFWNYYPSV